jgi:hypothetical protein
MVRHHTFFFLFALGPCSSGPFGGALSIAAVQFARRKITAADARVCLEAPWSGVHAGPVIPIAFISLVAVMLLIGGVFLRIPVLGDLVGAPLFIFALLGGLIIAVLLVGFLVGGSLFWPAVAVEGSDAFDAFSRSLAYPFSRPWKTIVYFLITGIYAVVCWLIVNILVYWAVWITREIVSWGTSPFGWWKREGDASKLEVLWPLGGASGLHRWPEWSQLGFFEDFSALMIGVYVLLTIGLTWSFLFSFCLSSDTIIYFLLRRDVDGNDVSDVHFDESKNAPPGMVTTPGRAEPAESTVTLPVINAPPPSTA